MLLLLLSLVLFGCPDNPPPPGTDLDPDFSADKNSLVDGQQVAFQATVTGGADTWSWSFEGGTPATSTSQNPVITYEEAGTFEVSLTITRGDASETVTKESYINVVSLFTGSELPAVGACQLNKLFTNDPVDLGFPNNGPSPALCEVNVHVLFADFPNAIASRTTESVLDLLDPVNKNFFGEMSYGRMELNLIPHHEWLRLSNDVLHYTGGLTSGEGHLAFIQEAVDLADDQVDFSNANIVVVMANPDTDQIPYGPTFGSLNPNFAIQADGNTILTGITSGFDLNHWGGIWLAHEMGHSLGLPDLYNYTSSDAHQHVGNFSMMSLISGRAPGFFAYERWLLGWLDDEQMYCHSQGAIAIELQQIATEGGLKAISVPLSESRSVVIESRRRSGFDASMSKEGVMVYVVDTTIGRGRGPIEVKPGVNSGPMKDNAPMVTGDVYTYEGVRVEVIETKASSDIVLVSVQ